MCTSQLGAQRSQLGAQRSQLASLVGTTDCCGPLGQFGIPSSVTLHILCLPPPTYSPILQEERTLCQQILEYRRVQELQEELERTQQRPVTVHEWALAAGYPSAHQLMAALQEGRKAERTMLLCHQGLVQSVAFRYALVHLGWTG